MPWSILLFVMWAPFSHLQFFLPYRRIHYLWCGRNWEVRCRASFCGVSSQRCEIPSQTATFHHNIMSRPSKTGYLLVETSLCRKPWMSWRLHRKLHYRKISAFRYATTAHCLWALVHLLWWQHHGTANQRDESECVHRVAWSVCDWASRWVHKPAVSIRRVGLLQTEMSDERGKNASKYKEEV